MDLLGAYALDAVDDDERQAIERHLDNCAQCRREVAEHREVAGMLASGWLPAPEGLWDRIAGSLEEPPPPLRMPSEAEGPAEAPPASGPPTTPSLAGNLPGCSCSGRSALPGRSPAALSR
jgi:anti-sigma factor RsiW